MTEKQPDLRILKTRESIKTALMTIISENGLEGITVKEITSRAKINRGTFYLHYNNIEQLLDEYFDGFIGKLYELFNCSLEEQRKRASEGNNIEQSFEIFNLNILKFIYEQQKMFKLLLLANKNSSYREKVNIFVKDILFNHENALIDEKDLIVPKEYYISYVLSSYMGVILRWLDRDCSESAEEVALILTTLNHHGIIVPPRNGY